MEECVECGVLCDGERENSDGDALCEVCYDELVRPTEYWND